MEPKESNSKKHFYISVVKSVIRILGCVPALLPSISPETGIICLASLFMAAECLGIAEEI
jgi:hypothetical protein|tara:strand:- start:204 stop:383 length:180 start_codon:yes stop_codon:yes gene_type:complete